MSAPLILARRSAVLSERFPELGAYGEAVMSHNPVAFWRFDTQSAESAMRFDRSGNGHRLYPPLVLGRIVDDPLVQGAAAHFSDKSDRQYADPVVEFSPEATGELTVEFWVEGYNASRLRPQTILSPTTNFSAVEFVTLSNKNVSLNSEFVDYPTIPLWSVGVDRTQLNVGPRPAGSTGTNAYTNTSFIPVNVLDEQRHHVAMTIVLGDDLGSGLFEATYEAFVDGVLVATVESDFQTGSTGETGVYLQIGRYLDTARIDEVAIYPSALTIDDFEDHIAAAGAEPTPPSSIDERAFTPTRWFRADDISGSDGSAVATWPARDGYTGDATQATSGSQPTLQTAEANGHAVVRFDGIDDSLSFSGFAVDTTGTPPTPVGVTVVVVWKASTFTDPRVILGTGGTYDSLAIGLNLETTVGDVEVGTVAAVARKLQPPSTVQVALREHPIVENWNITAVVINQSNVRFYNQDDDVDVGQPGSGGLNSAGTSHKLSNSNWRVGGNPAADDMFFEGDIAEIIVYDEALSNASADLAPLFVELAARYQVPYSPPLGDYGDEVMADDPVMYARFNLVPRPGDGTTYGRPILDETGNHTTGVWTGTDKLNLRREPFGSPGYSVGGAGQFGQSEDWNIATNGGTVEFWCDNAPSAFFSQTLIQMRNMRIEIALGGAWYVYMANNSFDAFSGGTAPRHIAVTIDPGVSLKVYVNGSLELDEDHEVPSSSGIYAPYDLKFDAQIDDLAVYSTPLSGSRIAAHYDARL